MTSPTLSAVIVAHNEEAMLPECLASVAFADEIVVTLDKCTDKSKEIVESFQHARVKIIQGAWEIEGERRAGALNAVTSDWVLEVDADERIPTELAAEIRRVIQIPDARCQMPKQSGIWNLESGVAPDGFKIPLDNYIGQRLVRHGWGGSFGTAIVLRLFKRGAKTWGMQRVHPKTTFAGTLGPPLQNRMIHYVDKSLSDTFARLNRYTTLNANDMRASGNYGSLFHHVRRLFSRFFKSYVTRKGYKEGVYGIAIALCAGLYPLMSYLKAKEDK